MYWQAYRNILKNEYRNPWFYFYLFCWLPACLIIIQGGSPWWTVLIVLGQLPFVFPMAVLIENPHLYKPAQRRVKKRRTSGVHRCPSDADAGTTKT